MWYACVLFPHAAARLGALLGDLSMGIFAYPTTGHRSNHAHSAGVPCDDQTLSCIEGSPVLPFWARLLGPCTPSWHLARPFSTKVHRVDAGENDAGRRIKPVETRIHIRATSPSP
ncbi:hypothetical protein F5148DRAFT_1173214 [Russula earlei]|uniref:Uncharacterized protein n=1 Tax=Russula earlei TaxID=71964 RepID=A0ACC0UHG4_9AGAM|nr:hypothetical protein F5148DRAFT_1173214 [Russula earlei]